MFLRKTHILGFVYVIFLRLRYVLVIRISLKQILSSFQGGKQIKKIKCGGHRSKITTITSFEKLILATFSKNLRYTCFLETGNSSARKTEIIFTTLDDNIDTSLTQKIFRWFCSNFFFYPSRGSGQTQVYYLNAYSPFAFCQLELHLSRLNAGHETFCF